MAATCKRCGMLMWEEASYGRHVSESQCIAALANRVEELELAITYHMQLVPYTGDGHDSCLDLELWSTIRPEIKSTATLGKRGPVNFEMGHKEGEQE